MGQAKRNAMGQAKRGLRNQYILEIMKNEIIGPERRGPT